MMDITYAREQSLPIDDYIAVVGSTYMRDKRPLTNRERIGRMLANATLIVTARADDGTILGLARGMGDDAWVCYIADLVVRDGQQGNGIGSALLDRCASILGPGVGLVLVAYPEADAFYRRIGMEPAQAYFRVRTDSS
jgi:GNAT superfamily N-acetyltransferase